MRNAGSRSESSVAYAHSWGEAPHENLRRVSDGGEPTTERIMCIHTIKRDHVTHVHCEIFITIHEATRPSPPNPHVLCVVTTLVTTLLTHSQQAVTERD